jgi:Spy/CpxP family protein refolding chaperone
MKSRSLILLLVISLGVNIGFLLHWAWPKIAPGSAGGAHSGWHTGPMKRHLGLSSEQARRMEGERRQVLDQAKPLQDKLRQKRRELFVLLKGKEVRDSELDTALNEIARLQAALEKIWVLHSLKARSALSPDQQRKYEGCLERGLCPGMLAGASGTHGRMNGHAMKRSGCDPECEKKK